MARMNELKYYRAARISCVVVAVAVDVVIVASDPAASVGSGLAVLAVTALALLAPTLVQLRVVASVERLLDERCDPASLVRRGDAMGLSGRIPRNGLYRTEAVLLHRYGVALVDEGRSQDAAVVRRRIEDGLAMRQHPARNMDCAVMAMLLADLCARLGDAGAARGYASQFLEGLEHVPRSARGGIDRDLEAVGGVTVRSSMALFLPAPAHGAPVSLTEGDVTALEGPGVGRRLAAEARTALAKAAAAQGEQDREGRLLEQVVDAAPRMRVGRLAASRLGHLADGAADVAEYGSLRLAPAVDAHAPVAKGYGGGPRARP